MSGFEVAGVLLGTYPLVVGAINVYKATKTGRAAAVLIRRLKTEAVIYRQFVHKLLVLNLSGEEIHKLLDPKSPDLEKRWQDVTLSQTLRGRLGPKKADLILEILREMDKLLKDLNAEFSNISRGIEILGKLRCGFRVAKYSMPQANVQIRLTQVSILNGDLARLIDGEQMISSTIIEDHRTPTRFLLRDCHEAIELYDAIQEGYNCDCVEPHVANFGLSCPVHTALPTVPDIKSYKWEFEIISHGQFQLFGLGRALLLKDRSRILILNEATSNVDLKTNELMQCIIKEEFAKYTILTIAYRLDTICDADVILIMDKGKVVDVGTPDELLAKKGEKKDLVEGEEAGDKAWFKEMWDNAH